MTHEERKKLGRERSKISHLILHEMRLRGWTQMRVASALGLSTTSVSRVVNGASHSQKILSKLHEIGVPEMYLYSPYPFVTVTTQEEK